MTTHLPECAVLRPADNYYGGACICPSLRACEQRVRDEALKAEYLRYEEAAIRDQDAAYRKGYAAALDAAREAVAAKAMHSPKCFALLPDFDERDCNCAVAYSIAAIDALKEKP